MAKLPIPQDARLNELLRRLEPAVRRAFEEAIRKARRSVDVQDLIRALEDQNLERAVELLRIRDQVLYPLGEAVRDAYIAGGRAVGESIPVVLRAQFGFGTNPRAEQQVARIVGEMIEGVQRDSLQMTRNVIAAGVREGIPNAKLARQITGEGRARTGGFLGLTAGQADSIVGGRGKLLSGDPRQMREYMRLELRNKRHDRTIEKAIREGRKLTVAEVDRIVSDHRTKALGYRGRVIARTETLNALRAGQYEGFEQLAEVVGRDRITVTWKTTLDGRQRDHHALLNGESVTMGETFTSPATGALMRYPGDNGLGAQGVDTVQCRCAAIYRVKRRER